MKRQHHGPTDQEVHEAVLRRIEQMSREEWSRSVEELSEAPKGVDDPWPPQDASCSDGSTVPATSRPAVRKRTRT